MAQPKAVENGLVCVQQRWFQVVVPRETQQFAFSNLDERYQITNDSFGLDWPKKSSKLSQQVALLSTAEIAELAESALLKCSVAVRCSLRSHFLLF